MNPCSSPLLTDHYQLMMVQSYLEHGMEETAVFELFVRKLPSCRNFMVAAGLEQDARRIAVEAALTGHMMLTTLHTNDAPGAVTRLTKMGIEAFLIASAVDCVVAQRLARKLCPHCKRRTVISQQALTEAELRVGADIEAYEPVGCGRCNQSGYRGRVGVFSVMTMSDRIKDMVVAQAPEAEIAAIARQEGMLTLREDGIAKVRAGLTSLEEVIRVTA